MPNPSRTSRTLHRRLRRAAALTALGLSLTAVQVGAVHADGHRDSDRGQADRELTVMTQNLYLGASLTPAVVAPDLPRFVLAVTGIWQSVQLTDFPARSEALAEEIAEEEPDLIGLQEVAEWTTTNTSTGTFEELDFLDVLLADLATEGLSYSVAAVSHNADIGPVPLALDTCPPPVGTCTIELRDRDVILVNDETADLRVLRSASGRFDAQVVLNTLAGPLSFDRGWTYVDAKLGVKKFRFLNTHLETDAFASVQEAQAAELLRPSGPLGHPGRAIAVGDFNSPAGSSTPLTYDALTSTFTDAWNVVQGPGLTCCHDPLLMDPTVVLRTRIDLILTRERVDATDAELIADAPFQTGPLRPFWVSDHAGVIADVTLR